MATQQQINAAVDSIVAAFGGNLALWDAFLKRARLETDYQEIESKMRQLQAKEQVQNAGFIDALGKLQADLEAKQAEIDALNGG
jgi:hypothetical protein